MDAEWLLGVRAAGWIRPPGRCASPTGARCAPTASSSRPAPPPAPGRRPPPAGAHTLRTLDDAGRLRAALRAGAERVVVIGAGFIGAEVASSCAALGLSVTVVEAAPLPWCPNSARRWPACAALHADHGVTLCTGVGVAGLLGTGRVTGVALTDGRTLPADVVVVGVGIRPTTTWLEGSGIAVDDGCCATRVRHRAAERRRRRGRGPTARSGRPAAAPYAPSTGPAPWTRGGRGAEPARGATVEPYAAVPYFWSDQYGARLQFAGTGRPGTPCGSSRATRRPVLPRGLRARGADHRGLRDGPGKSFTRARRAGADSPVEPADSADSVDPAERPERPGRPERPEPSERPEPVGRADRG
ncbi:FAD-dependent oxidoreductase [Streptomyces sp. M19]